MTKSKLMEFVGKQVYVCFGDGDVLSGVLRYADEFSSKHFYHSINLFYIGCNSFKASEVRKIELWERK